MKRKFRFLFVLIPVAFITLAVIITMGLWNWLMPALFGLGTLTFLQAGGLLLLAKILFGHKGHRGWHSHRMQYAFAGKSCGGFHTHPRFAHHMQHLSAEQREKMASRCGFHYHEENTNKPAGNENK